MKKSNVLSKLLFVLALSLSYIFIIPRFPVVLPSLWSFCDKVLDHPTSHMRGHSLYPLCRDCGPLNAADSAFLYRCPALCFLALNPPSLTLFFCLSINFSHQDAKFAPLPSHHKLLQPLHSRLNSDEWIFPALIIRRSSGRALLPAAVFISYWEADLKQISGRMARMLREAVREHRIWERKRRMTIREGCNESWQHFFCTLKRDILYTLNLKHFTCRQGTVKWLLSRQRQQ